jgi:hypothetical protein
MEIYGSSEYVKFLMEETTSWSSTITYLWYANYWPKGYTAAADTAKPIWKIRKIVTTWSVTETFYANGSSSFDSVRDDRATLTYL